MTLDLLAILPNLSNGLDNTGLLFGAGTSVEAGYPVLADLTREVVNGLSTTERSTLDEVLHASAISYDHIKAEPNIEQIADLVMAHSVNSGGVRFAELETRLRVLITDVILALRAQRSITMCASSNY